MTSSSKRPSPLALALLSIALVILLAQPLSQWLMGPYLFVRMRTTRATYGELEAATRLKGVLIRDETVVMAPIPGAVHTLVTDGSRVRKGSLVLRLDDTGQTPGEESAASALPARLARLEGEGSALDDLIAADKLAMASSDASAAAQGRAQLAEHVESLRRVSIQVSDVRSTMRVGGASAAGWSGGTSPEYRATKSGLASFSTDGLEGALTLRGHREDLLAVVEDVLTRGAAKAANATGEPLASVTTDHTQARLGQPLARVVNNFVAYLAVPVPSAMAESWAHRRLKIGFASLGGRSCLADLLAAYPMAKTGSAMCLLSLAEYLPEFTDLRVETVDIVDDRAEGVLVPAAAIAHSGRATGVFIAKGAYPVWQSVTIRARGQGRCVVDGLPEGSRVVRNPKVVPARFR